MEIILLEKIQNVGELGDLVTVKNGYARNYLIPQKKAMLATADAKAKVEEKRQQLAQSEAERLAAAKERADAAVKAITLVRLCGEEGQLYGSVSPIDIAEAMVAAGTAIEKSEVTQPDGAIKHTGSYQADVILHPEVRFTIDITVEGEQGEGDPMAEVTEPEASPEAEAEENTEESA